MNTCQTCTNWKPKDSGQMARHGFAFCGLGKRYTFFPPQHTCQKHQSATPEITAAREKWLSK